MIECDEVVLSVKSAWTIPIWGSEEMTQFTASNGQDVNREFTAFNGSLFGTKKLSLTHDRYQHRTYFAGKITGEDRCNVLETKGHWSEKTRKQIAEFEREHHQVESTSLAGLRLPVSNKTFTYAHYFMCKKINLDNFEFNTAIIPEGRL